eukprot:846891-Alexandrium_andersonii.AAC.1
MLRLSQGGEGLSHWLGHGHEMDAQPLANDPRRISRSATLGTGCWQETRKSDAQPGGRKGADG